MSTVQKNQHYVWKHYLNAWAVENKVWCVRAPSATAFLTNPSKIASETFFYRFRELDDTKAAIDRYFADRNRQFQENPKRAGNSIWGKELVPAVFSEAITAKTRGGGDIAPSQSPHPFS